MPNYAKFISALWLIMWCLVVSSKDYIANPCFFILRARMMKNIVNSNGLNTFFNGNCARCRLVKFLNTSKVLRVQSSQNKVKESCSSFLMSYFIDPFSFRRALLNFSDLESNFHINFIRTSSFFIRIQRDAL